MAKRRRGTRRGRAEDEPRASGDGSGGLFGQVGLFETANGWPHGPVAIALAIVAAVLILPIRYLIRSLTRRS
jgi:hypothetical protein